MSAPIPPPQILLVSGSTSEKSSTRSILLLLSGRLAAAGCTVDLLDMAATPLSLFNPDISYRQPEYAALKERVERADVFVLGTPDYHGSMSSALKNFLDHFWTEYAGKLIAPVVASHDKGLTVVDQIRTVARQCYAWSMPYAVCFADKTDVKDGQVVSEPFAQRLDMFVRDAAAYGGLLAAQRRADLAGSEPGFMARFRPSPKASP
jgi:NAD(P)H-dependent FMN reductase